MYTRYKMILDLLLLITMDWLTFYEAKSAKAGISNIVLFFEKWCLKNIWKFIEILSINAFHNLLITYQIK